VGVQQAKGVATRERLVDVATVAFAEQGYFATSLDELLDRSQLSKGSLYHAFPDGKPGLFRAVATLADERLHAQLRDAISGIDDPLDQITAGALAFLKAATDPTIGRIVLIDAPTVLADGWTAESEQLLVVNALDDAAQLGLITNADTAALGQLLFGAIHRAGVIVAGQPRRRLALSRALSNLIEGLRID
jgi:AcrR family transcriptional regulator